MPVATDTTFDDMTSAYRQAAKDRSSAVATFRVAAKQRRICWQRYLGMHRLMVTGVHSPEKLAWYEDFLDREADAILDLQESMRTCKNVIRDLDRLLYEDAEGRPTH